MLSQMNGKVRPWNPPDVTITEYERAVIRLLLFSNSDWSSTRYGVLSPEEIGVLERVGGVQR